MRNLQRPFVVGLVSVLSACSDSADGPAASLEISLAPLELAGIGDVEYHLRVENALGDVVWDAPSLLSSRYGDSRGALTYIGPCDASDGANPHTVSLWIKGITDTEGDDLVSPEDWKNPTREPSGNDPGIAIRRTDVVCVENADVLVELDVTVMRAARQGFFDIAVNFEDVFCSAKLDCVDQLLHDPSTAGTPRGPTVVLGFACTSGTKADAPEATHLYLSDLRLVCDKPGAPLEAFETRLPVAAITEDGKQGAVPRGVYDWARYSDQEAFDTIDKCFWNFAIGLDTDALAGFDCRLVASGTASATPFGGNLLPANAVHPFVAWDVQVIGSTGALCDEQPLDAPGSGVTSEYSYPEDMGIDADVQPFTAHYLCGDPPPAAVSCAPAPAEPATLLVEPLGQDLAVSAGGAPATFRLPAGWSLGAQCDPDACCQQ